jgi:Tfp pilus assembly protein PilO
MNTADLMEWIAVVRRHPLSVLCGIIVVLCGFLSWLIYGDMKGLELERSQLAQDGDLMVATLITGPSVRTELEVIREITRRLDDNLVVEDNLAENLWYFYKIEQLSKAHLTELHQLSPLLPDSRSLYKRIPYALTVTGTYEQTGAFLYAIETGPRLANLTAVSFRRTEPGSPGLNLEIRLELLGKK